MADPNPQSSDLNNSDSKSGVTLSPGQTKAVFWLAGVAPIAKALTPPATYWGEARKKIYGHLPVGVGAARLYQSVMSDVCRQAMTCTFQLVSYFIAGDLIKLGLKKYYDRKAALAANDNGKYSDAVKKKDDAKQQVIVQVASLFIQVIATILSRPFGAAQLIGLFHQEDKATAPKNATRWKIMANNLVSKHLRHPVTGYLMPKKAAWAATGIISLYLGTLVGALYGLSTLMQKAFGTDNTKSKKPTASDSQQNQPQNPTVASPAPWSMPSQVTPLSSFHQPQNYRQPLTTFR